MNRKFIYLINPISGTKNKSPLINHIFSKTSERNIPFEIIDTKKDGDYSFLKEKIAAEQITDVIICGGDGTINQVVKALLTVKVTIGIIPMGSGNGLALAARISKNYRKALEIIFNGKTSLVDGFYVNNQFSCMLSGLGFDAQVAHDFSLQKSRGLFTYIKQSLKNFFNYKTYEFIIHINGERINTDAFFVSIANSNQFGNYITIAPQASLHDGLLDIIIVNKKNKVFTAFSLLQHIKLGKVKADISNQTKKKSITYLQSTRLTIENLSLAPLHIDGEPYPTAANIEVKVIPSAFNLLQP